MTYKEIYEGLQKEANMKKEATMKVAGLLKEARLGKKAGIVNKLIDFMRERAKAPQK